MPVLQRALTMGKSLQSRSVDAEENVWIQIIRQMESLYAQLADAQSDIEERARQLGEAKELADNIIRSMNDALIVLDAAGRVSMVNAAAARMFGYPEQEMLGMELSALVPEKSAAQWRWPRLRGRIAQEGGSAELETSWQDARGRRIPCGVSGAPLRGRWGDPMGAVLVVRDLREAKRRVAEARAATRAARAKTRELEKANAELTQLQAELIQAAKMSSLGRLAAGVAHELNNPLGSILLYSDLVIEDTLPDDARRPNLERIAQQAARCRQIVRGLLDFGRPAETSAGPLDMNAVLRQALNVLDGQQMFHNVEVRWELADALPVIRGDAAQLQQAFTNIVLNGVDAMRGQGTLTLRTAPEPEGDGVQVEIQDTGCGIPPENVPRLFEPFFTTKDDGTGLGLAITYGIVERHHGTVDVASQPGLGTTFRLTIRSMNEGRADA
jgi:two-component system NtrC family sensor kinase